MVNTTYTFKSNMMCVSCDTPPHAMAGIFLAYTITLCQRLFNLGPHSLHKITKGSPVKRTDEKESAETADSLQII